MSRIEESEQMEMIDELKYMILHSVYKLNFFTTVNIKDNWKGNKYIYTECENADPLS